MPNSFFQSINDSAPIRQGDIIVNQETINTDPAHPTKHLGVIMTADCDIAQAKMGEYYTYVSIVPAQHYLENVWGYEELQKIRTLFCGRAVQFVYEIDKLRDPAVRPISPAELLSWLQEDGVAGVLGALEVSQRKRIEAERLLNIWMLAEELRGYYSTPLQRLQACWTASGRSINEQQRSLRSALVPRQMRLEYILLPSLPFLPGIGFVILLRDIRSIRVSALYENQLEYRLTGSDGMYRIGRFSDFLRHSIAQRFGSLFSRIALTTEFEDECELAGELIAVELCGRLIHPADVRS